MSNPGGALGHCVVSLVKLCVAWSLHICSSTHICALLQRCFKVVVKPICIIRFLHHFHLIRHSRLWITVLLACKDLHLAWIGTWDTLHFRHFCDLSILVMRWLIILKVEIGISYLYIKLFNIYTLLLCTLMNTTWYLDILFTKLMLLEFDILWSSNIFRDILESASHLLDKFGFFIHGCIFTWIYNCLRTI